MVHNRTIDMVLDMTPLQLEILDKGHRILNLKKKYNAKEGAMIPGVKYTGGK